MARDYFSDISPESGQHDTRSIRNIPINTHRPGTRPQATRPPSAPRFRSPDRKGAGALLWGAAFVAVLLVLTVGAITILRKTSVVVEPSTHTVVFDETQAYSAVPADTLAEGVMQMAYHEATVEVEARTPVNASGTEQVEEFASGTIVVYNDHQSTPLRLIKNTRFETPDGYVFRVRDSIVVPGKTAAGPGKLEVTVFADQAGPEYNKGPVERFTLPALKTSAPDMYAAVYASSQSAFTGGYRGARPVVAQSDLENAYRQLETELRAKIEAEAANKVPVDAFSFPQRMNLSFEDSPAESGEGAATVGRRAVARIPYIDRLDFARAIAGATSAEAGEGVVTLPDAATFTITLASSTGDTKELTFTLEGTARFVWAIDTADLAKNLAGKSKGAFKSIIEGYPGAGNAQAYMRPFWRANFPENPEEIVIILSQGK